MEVFSSKIKIFKIEIQNEQKFSQIFDKVEFDALNHLEVLITARASKITT